MKKYKLLLALAALMFATFFAFWVWLAWTGKQGETAQAEFFSATYGLMALYGGLLGLYVAQHWGGFKSLIGRSVTFLSLGLLAQELGQITYSVYTYVWHQEIPYPSLGDIGYFGSVILYILATYSLVRAVSVKSTFKSKANRAWIVLVPLLLLGVSGYFFLKGHAYDTSNPVSVVLDFGYPVGQALYLTLAVLAFLLSKRYLGGIMKPVIVSVIFALFLQYVADFTFLYQVSRETWKTGGINELMYLVSYFVMTTSLLRFGTVMHRLKHGVEQSDVE